MSENPDIELDGEETESDDYGDVEDDGEVDSEDEGDEEEEEEESGTGGGGLTALLLGGDGADDNGDDDDEEEEEDYHAPEQPVSRKRTRADDDHPKADAEGEKADTKKARV